jgi:hypothetical protein
MGIFLSVIPLFFLSMGIEQFFVQIVGASLSSVDWVLVPLFFAGVIGFGIYLALPLLKSDLKENRQRNNKCTHCGYLLRGIRDTSKVCPECGYPFKPKP